MIQGTERQKVRHLALSLSYPDGWTAEFNGDELYADIKVDLGGYPADLEIQDLKPLVIAHPYVGKLVIEVTLTLDGRLSMETRPPEATT